MIKEDNTYIEATLRSLGLSSSYKGFRFLVYAINLVMENSDILTYICKGLYLEIALHYDTTITCVERNIRTAKEIIWINGNQTMLRNIFGNLYNHEIPNNTIFIDLLTYYVSGNMK